MDLKVIRDLLEALKTDFFKQGYKIFANDSRKGNLYFEVSDSLKATIEKLDYLINTLEGKGD